MKQEQRVCASKWGKTRILLFRVRENVRALESMRDRHTTE